MPGKNDIDLQVAVRGTAKAKRKLRETGKATKKMGDDIAGGAKKATKGIEGLAQSFVGRLGLTAAITAVVLAGVKFIKFLDEVKAKVDLNIQAVLTYRKTLESLQESTGAVGEAERVNVARNVALLATQTGASVALTKDIADQYRRQFVEQMTPDDFAKARRETIGYAARHGGPATADLIRVMGGFGVTTAEGQGAFRRQIAASAERFKITDAEMIGLMGRLQPTAVSLEMTPEESMAKLGILAQGLTGRKARTLPVSTLEALALPTESAAQRLGLGEGATPGAIFQEFQKQAAGMTPAERHLLAGRLYSTAGAAGAVKLIAAGRPDTEFLRQAAGPVGRAAEEEDQRQFLGTLEARQNIVDASRLFEKLKAPRKQQTQKLIRDIGREYQEQYQRDTPIAQEFRERLIIGRGAEAEEAARRRWLSRDKLRTGRQWRLMSEEERLQALLQDQAGGVSPATYFEEPPGGVNNSVNVNNFYNVGKGGEAPQNAGPVAGQQ